MSSSYSFVLTLFNCIHYMVLIEGYLTVFIDCRGYLTLNDMKG